jgi:hypothetical protein
VVPDLAELTLDELRLRLEQLDALALAEEFQSEDRDERRAEVFEFGGDEEDAWNNYHLVRNEYDRRAAEEFDLGQ